MSRPVRRIPNENARRLADLTGVSRRDFLRWSGVGGAMMLGAPLMAANVDSARLRRASSFGMSHAGWTYDAYPNLDQLKANHSMVIANIEGPGILHRLHTIQHKIPEESISPMFRADAHARGVVLEVYYNGSAKPSVCVPLADFFLDGCRRAQNFSTPFLEKAPRAYNSFIAMPFEKSAKVVLRNDLPFDLANYSFVEWEKLPQWDASLGYFHATWKRDAFQLHADTDRPFFRVDGAGQLFGRSATITTDEPLFEDFTFVMEGNNEVRIDGAAEPEADYLGTEDSFRLSWGWTEPFIGQRNGTTFVQQKNPALLTTYCFWDEGGIPFDRSFDLRIDWSHEFRKLEKFQEQLAKRNATGGCWVDYASTYYWYQKTPGFTHHPMQPVEERNRVVAHQNPPA